VHLVATISHAFSEELALGFQKSPYHTTPPTNVLSERQSCEPRISQREAESVVPVACLDEILEVEGNVNKHERHAAQAAYAPPCGPWFRNVVQQWLRCLSSQHWAEC